MIKTEIIHPDLLQALAQCGHKAIFLSPMLIIHF